MGRVSWKGCRLSQVFCDLLIKTSGVYKSEHYRTHLFVASIKKTYASSVDKNQMPPIADMGLHSLH